MDDKSEDDLATRVGKMIAQSVANSPLSREEAEERLRVRFGASDKPEPASPARRKPFDLTVTWPLILSVLALLCTGATGTVAWVMKLQADAHEFKRDIAEIKRGREADNQESAKIRLVWTPRIEGAEREVQKLASENVVQNSRMENMIEAIRDNRRWSDAVMTTLNVIQVDVASIKARLPDKRAEAKTR